MDTALLAVLLTSLAAAIQLQMGSVVPTTPCERQYCREPVASTLKHSHLQALGLTAIGAIVPCSMGLTFVDCQAEQANDIARNANAPNEITCDLRDRADLLDTALAPRDDRWPSVFLDDEIADIPIWKTVSSARTKVLVSFAKLWQGAMQRGDLAAEALDDTAFPISESRATVELAVLTVAKLRFRAEGAPLREIYARAAKLGLELCPAEVGPQLRLQHTDQPLREFLHIAMQPVATNRENLVALAIGNGGGGLLSLIGGDGRPDLVVPSTVRFVFVRRPSPGQHSRRRCGTSATAGSRGRHRFNALKCSLNRKSLPARRRPERKTDLVMRLLAKGEEREEQSQ